MEEAEGGGAEENRKQRGVALVSQMVLILMLLVYICIYAFVTDLPVLSFHATQGHTLTGLCMLLHMLIVY